MKRDSTGFCSERLTVEVIHDFLTQAVARQLLKWGGGAALVLGDERGDEGQPERETRKN